MGGREPCAAMTLMALFHIQSQHRELHTTSLKQLQGEEDKEEGYILKVKRKIV